MSSEMVKRMDGLTEANFKLRTSLIMWLGENERRQRRFMDCFLVRLSKVDTALTEIQGCQLADFWQRGKVSDEKRTAHLKELEAKMRLANEQIAVKMTHYNYGKTQVPEPPHDRRRRWWGWEI